MQLAEDSQEGRYHLTHVDATGVTVNGTRYTQNLVLGKNFLSADLLPETLDALDTQHMHALLAHKPQIILIGTGQTQRLLDPAFFLPFHTAKVGVEVMNTPAAARTANVLLAENRNLLALLFIAP